MDKFNRYACLHDLLKYFKRSDLLGGLSELEQSQVRKNLGIIDLGIGQDKYFETSYELFNEYRITNKLIPGAYYVITDYQTIYSSNVLNSKGQFITWGTNDSVNPSKTYRLVVCAISNNATDPKAIILEDSNWTILYDPTKKILDDGTSNKGTITYMKDLNDNSAYYDFKNVKFRRTQLDLANSNIHFNKSQGDFYTFSNIKVNDVIEDSSDFGNTIHNELKHGCYNNVFIGDTYNNKFEADCENNTFLNGCHDNIILWASTSNNFKEPVCFLNGKLNNIKIPLGQNILSSSITKSIHKVNEATIVVYLDPITYVHQIFPL